MKRLFLALVALLSAPSLALAERDCVGVVYYDPDCNLAQFSCQSMDVAGTPVSVLGLREVSFLGAKDLDRSGPYLLLRVWDFDGTVDVIYDFPGSDKFIGLAGAIYSLHVIRINLEENGGQPEFQAVDHRFSVSVGVDPEIFIVPDEFALAAASASDVVLWQYQGPDRMALTAAVQSQYVFDPCR